MRWVHAIVVGMVALLFQGCRTTLYMGLMPRSLAPAELPAVARKRVVIVFEDDKVPAMATVPFGITFIETRHLRPSVEQGLIGLVGASTAAVDIAVGGRPPGYDLYILPTVQLSLPLSFVVSHCEVTTVITVVDRNGRVVGTRQAAASSPYVSMIDQARACSLSVSKSLEEASRAALAAPGRAPRVGGPAT
jgi:hypothetical protein